VTRDIDLLRKMRSMVALTITTKDDNLSRKLEPHAPVSSERLRAIKVLARNGIPVAARIDPIIPFLNGEPENLIESLACRGVSHITSSTYKIRPDNWRRLDSAFPRIARKISSLYFEKGERISGYLYLPRDLRHQTMKRVKELTKRHGMKFGCCRESFSHLNSALCDGSWLVQ
jgi:DNA repair photolyase